jgi:hypothetical protein
LFCLLSDENSCSCIRIAKVDPKGSIPAMVVNLAKQNAAKSFSRLNRLIEDL